MDDTIWKRRFDRERAARKAAEQLLETKSHALWDAHHQIAAANESLEQRVAERTAELEAARDAAEDASRTKSAFLANMSHELRTPMNGVIGTASLLALTELSEDQRSLVGTIDASATDLLGLLNEILDLSKIEAGKLSLEVHPFDLVACARGVVTLLGAKADEGGLRLHLDVDPSLTAFRIGDETRTRQVLLNLIGNAIKFTQEGQVTLRVDGDEDQVRLQVIDTGVGIPADRLERVFDDFEQADSSTTRRFGGTGLGLAISRRLVNEMGGELGVVSTLDVGSTFSAQLPLPATEPVMPVARPNIGERSLRPGALVLLAEDNLVNQKVAQRMLERAGCVVAVAGNGREALEAFQAGDWDLVLLDWQMPELSGLEVAQAIRAFEAEHMRASTPVVAMTANAMQGDRETCLRAGMDAYLAKPIRYEELVQALSRWIPAERAA